MTFVVLVILAVVWAVYLASWVRSRTEHRRVNSINSFSQHLSVLERTTPGSRSGGSRSVVGRPTGASLAGIGGPTMVRRTTLSQAKKRRRDVLMGLLAATGITFLGTIAMGGPVRYLFGLSLVLSVGYVMALASIQKRALERRSKVRYLDGSGAPAVWTDEERVDEGWADDAWADEGEAAYSYPVGQIYAVHGR